MEGKEGDKPQDIEVVVVAGRGWSPLYARVMEKQLKVLSRRPPGIKTRITYVISIEKPGARRLVSHLAATAARLGLKASILELSSDKGVSHARNKALIATRSQLIGFLDDDVIPAPRWLETLTQVFKDPRVAGTFGSVHPVFLGNMCRRIPRSLYWIFSCTPSYAPKERSPFYRGFGANMAFRREALISAGGFQANLGVGANNPRGILGEDAELGLRMCRSGRLVVYEPRLKAYHIVPPDRCTARYVATRAFTVGRTNRAITIQHGLDECRDSGVLKVAMKALISDASSLPRRPSGLPLLVLGSLSFLAGYLAG